MIKLISGVYGARGILKRPGDGPFSLSDEEEARLVRRGVAEYVFHNEQTDVFHDDEEAYLPRYSVDMKMEELKKIATYYGVDTSKCKKKQDIVDLLDEHFENLEEELGEDGSNGEDAEDGDDPARGAETPMT